MTRKKEPRITEEGVRETYTYVLLLEASQYSLDDAQNRSSDYLYPCLHSIISAAFSLEAYMNHVGPQVFRTTWSDIEALRPKEKLEAIARKLDVSPDFARRPFQSFTHAFRVRNLAAHGRTEIEPYEVAVKSEEHDPQAQPLPRLMRLCSKPKARQVFEDASKMIVLLHKATGRPGSPLWFRGHTTWSRTQR